MKIEDLEPAEREKLLKFPAYISLLAADTDDKLDLDEKRAATRFCHIKTFTCDPLLSDFYREAEKHFAETISKLDDELPKAKSERRQVIQAELEKLEPIVQKLGPDFARVMRYSMQTFKDHVSKAHNNALEYFLFPLPIKGITY